MTMPAVYLEKDGRLTAISSVGLEFVARIAADENNSRCEEARALLSEMRPHLRTDIAVVPDTERSGRVLSKWRRLHCVKDRKVIGYACPFCGLIADDKADKCPDCGKHMGHDTCPYCGELLKGWFHDEV